MAAIVVWLDSQNAKIFTLSTSGVEERKLKTHGHQHPTEPHGHHGGGHHHESEPMFKDISHSIADASEILILGPGEAKTRFKHHLESHHRPLSQKIVGVETVDHPTDNQILEIARKFFKKHDLFA